MEDYNSKSSNGSRKKTNSKLNDSRRDKSRDSDKVCENTFLNRTLVKSDNVLRNQDDKARDKIRENLGRGLNSFFKKSDETFNSKKQVSTPFRVPQPKLGGSHSEFSRDKKFANKSIHDDTEVSVGRFSYKKTKTDQKLSAKIKTGKEASFPHHRGKFKRQLHI